MSSWLDSIELSLLAGSCTELGPWWRYDRMLDPFDRVYLFESGRAWIEHGGQRWQMRPGWVYVIPAGRLLSVGCSARAVVSWVHVVSSAMGTASVFDLVSLPSALDLSGIGASEYQCLSAVIRHLHQLRGSDGRWDCLMQRGELARLYAMLLTAGAEVSAEVPTELSSRWLTVLQWMRLHLADRITLSDLAQQVHLEPTWFAKCFARQFGLPPMRYLRKLRVEKAQRLLLSTDWKLSRIAESCGWYDSFHLSRQFKQVVGLSPTAYRRRASGMQQPGG